MNKAARQLYAHVAPAIPLKSASPQWFTYAVASDMQKNLTLYSRVLVPFGRRLLPGIVLNINTTVPSYATKALQLLPGAGLTSQQVKFATWIAQTMQGGLGYTLRLFTPPPGEVPASFKPSFRLGPRTKPVAGMAAMVRSLQRHTVLYTEANRAERLLKLRDLVKTYWRAKKQVLIVVPEKWMIESIAALFPSLPAVAIIHGGLSPSKQKDIWYRVKSSHIRLVIGTQKSLFLPWQRLGLIIVEEEQHPSHKLWDQYPRLSNMVAVKYLKSIYNCHVLLTASFPSLASWSHVQSGAIKQVGGTIVTPTIRSIAATLEDQRARHLLPQAFVNLLRTWYGAGQHILLLHARKGSWQTIVCAQCHLALRCPHCELALIVKGSGQKAQLACQHCNFTMDVPTTCPRCRKGKLRFFGPGSETLAFGLGKIVPPNQVFSLDADVFKRLTPTALRNALASRSVVLSTSALLREDLPQEFHRLVWLFPESSLLYPDVRTHERHLIELARLQALAPGQSITLVTRQPELVKEQLAPPLNLLYPRLLKERQRLHYPPTTDMVRLSVAGTTTHQAVKKGIHVRDFIEKRMTSMGEAALGIRLRGPFQSFHKRERNQYQVHLLLLGDLAKLTLLYRGLPVDIVDVDPQRIM